MFGLGKKDKGDKSVTKLGWQVREKVTGFVGIVTYEVDHMYGCKQYGVSAPMGEDGTIKDAEFFDEGRLEKIGDGVDTTGGIPEWPTHINMGDKVRDKVTGFEGIMTGYSRQLFGETRAIVVPAIGEKNDMKEAQWITADRVELVRPALKPEDVQAEKKGGPNRDIPRGLR